MKLWVVYKGSYPDDGLLGVYDREDLAQTAAVGVWRCVEVWRVNGGCMDLYYLSPEGRRSETFPR